MNLEMPMRNAAVGVILAIFVVASLGIGYLSGNNARATETVTSVSTSTVTSTTTPTSTQTSFLTGGILVPTSSASMLNPLTGLSLDLNLSVINNVQIVLTAYEFNTLDRIDNVSYGSSWPNASLFQWTQTSCYDPGMEGYEVLQGNYGSNNFTDGQALWLQPQNDQPQCGLETTTTSNSSYIFQPLSARNILSETCVGYWIEDETYAQFAPGMYTVLAGDQWGQVAILHFVVAGG
jgi:hypothetical protein